MPQLALYFAPGACSFVPHTALEAIKAATGQPFELRMLKLHKGEQRAPEYLALNPDGVVPTLLVDGTPITQIVSICDYLDRHFPQAHLFPAEPPLRAQALSLFAWINNTAHPTFAHIFRPARYSDNEAAQASIQSFNLGKFRECLARLDAAAANANPYLFGAHPGVVDMYSLVLTRWGANVGIDPEGFPALWAHLQKLAALPAFAAAIATERIEINTFKKA
jgi:glutathione S-transferase